MDDIYYCVVEERIIYVFMKKDEYLVNLGIVEFYDSLLKDIFFRCYRFYIVNINKIREIIFWFNNIYNLKF